MYTNFDMVCQDCHGSMFTVGNSISQGRTPWLEEPSCGAAACHGDKYAEESGKLFRQSRGHGNLYCSACHGSPHAILPSGNSRDNAQNIALQGKAGTLSDCRVCHGIIPSNPGPHGMIPVMVEKDETAPAVFSLLPNHPNPFNPATTISFRLLEGGMVTIMIMNETGQKVATLVDHQYYSPGTHQHIFNASAFATGVYHIILEVDGNRQSRKILFLK